VLALALSRDLLLQDACAVGWRVLATPLPFISLAVPIPLTRDNSHASRGRLNTRQLRLPFDVPSGLRPNIREPPVLHTEAPVRSYFSISRISDLLLNGLPPFWFRHVPLRQM
jgi:hypothetical protein